MSGRELGIIERGEVTTAEDGYYTVKSIDREGIETPPLRPLMDGYSFTVGQKVCYFYFKDGTGRIVCDL
jgi:hypothetical protein